MAASTSAAQPAQAQAQNGEQAPSKTHPNDVGWQFVPQYYKYVNKHPDRLHCFYNKKSTFVHGDEGDDTTPCFGQHEIHEKITSIGYSNAKVYIHSIDSQSSAGGGIIILVIGEMANADGPWRKFTQTFFLAEQPNGYFVLNDIFRYLREDNEDEDEQIEAEAEPKQQEAPKPEVVEAVSTYSAKDTVTKEEEKEKPAPVEDVAPTPVQEKKPEVVEESQEEATTVADPTAEEAPKKEEPAVVPPPKAPEPEVKAVEAETESKPAPVSAPAPAPAEPAAPAKPPVKAAPKSWASLAAGASGSAWGARSTPAAAPAAAPAAPAAAAPAPSPSPAAAPPQQQRSQHSRQSALDAVSSVQTPHCFVKLPNWSISNEQQSNDPIDETTVRAAVTRFGEVVKVEIVKAKACAFVEFAKVESARKAIIASLPVGQGGEGGVKVGEGRMINLEMRKEKEDRAKGAKRPVGQGQSQGSQGQGQQFQQVQGQGQFQQQGQQGQQGQQPRQQQNGARGGRGGGGGAGRGGRAPQGGDKAPLNKA